MERECKRENNSDKPEVKGREEYKSTNIKNNNNNQKSNKLWLLCLKIRNP